LKAVRNQNIHEMMRYEDIMINLDDVLLNQKRDFDLNGRIQSMFKEREKTLAFKREDTVENLTIEVSSFGIFDAIKQSDLKKIVTAIVQKNVIDEDYNVLKVEVMKKAMELNEKKKEQKAKSKSSNSTVTPLLILREKALAAKKHPYELLK